MCGRGFSVLVTSSQKHDLRRRFMGSTTWGILSIFFFADPMFVLISGGLCLVFSVFSLPKGELKLGGIPEPALESWLVTRANICVLED